MGVDKDSEQLVLLLLPVDVDESEKKQIVSEVNGNVSNMKIISHFDSSTEKSSINMILSFVEYQDDSSAKLHEILKPGGAIILYKIIDSSTENKNIFSDETSKLRLAGFRIKENKNISLSLNMKIRYVMKNNNSDVKLYSIEAEKPNYEMGSSVALSFAAKPKPTVWKLDDVVDDDLIDDDDLLDESDKVKPTETSLRVCGTTGKRKACKDCSCGLAEELSGEVVDEEPKKSSCGSCYLGDAFRCASCPYLGMPAFKPGEKVQLSDV